MANHDSKLCLQRDIGLICRSTSIPIATGERLYDRWEAADVLGEGVAVLQPDVSHAYGINEVMRISATADVHGVHLAPQAPGLGIEIDEDRVRAAARCPDEGRSPVWSLPDGSYAEW